MRKSVTLALALLATAATAQVPAYHPKPQGKTLDLAGPFHARSPWRLVVTEGTLAKDYGDNDAPGALTLCLHKGPSGPCVSDPVTLPLRKTTPDDPIAWEPHYLLDARMVYPHGPQAAPFLLIVTGSLNSGDGDQLVSTQLVAYDPARDAFRRVFGRTTGHNNNQEIRFVTGGPLQGAVISATPQQHLPYGFWITVEKPTPAGAYRQVLRYPSATIYNDGNPLAVIDSEMPSIQQRLGLWKAGDPLPAPAGCRKPVLKHSELWCG